MVNMGTSLIRHVCQQQQWQRHQQCLLRLFYFIFCWLNSNAASDVHTFYLNIVHTKSQRREREGERGWQRERRKSRKRNRHSIIFIWWVRCRHTSHFNWPRVVANLANRGDTCCYLPAAGAGTNLVAICLTCIVWVHSEISIELQTFSTAPPLPKRNSNRNSRFIASMVKLSAENLVRLEKKKTMDTPNTQGGTWCGLSLRQLRLFTFMFFEVKKKYLTWFSLWLAACACTCVYPVKVRRVGNDNLL